MEKEAVFILAQDPHHWLETYVATNKCINVKFCQ